jgi:outer membrane protein
MKHVFLIALVFTAFIFPVTVLSQTVPLASVDLQRVMLESEKGKEAKKILTDEAGRVKKNLDVKQDELQRLKDGIEKQAATITPEARAEKEKQYQTKLKDYQRIYNDAQTELQQKDMELTQRILKEIEEVVKNIGTRDKYTIIFERSQGGILYSSPAIDITNTVIAAYNASLKQKAPKK